MAFCQMHWFSEVLGKQTTTWILLPDNLPAPFKTLYLLHGLSDDYSMWMRRTRIEMHAAGKPLIVVMPDGGRGFYTNHEQGPRWADHIGLELPEMIEGFFPAMKTRVGRCIGGLSMGGYGAMRVGLGFADRFSSVNSHSGALQYGIWPQETTEWKLTFGANATGTEHDLDELARRAMAAGNLPRIRIDCGMDDFLLDANRLMHRSLDEMKIAHEYQEYPGAHTWDYWDLHVREAIAFHLDGLEA